MSKEKTKLHQKYDLPEVYSDSSIKLLERRFLRRDKDGNVEETIPDMFTRIAGAISEVDREYNATDEEVKKTFDEFYNVLYHLRFIPNSPVFYNAGKARTLLSACFVLPIEDNLESIFNTLRDAVLCHQYGGGCGFNFSKIRPSSDSVRSISGAATGPVEFMKTYSNALSMIRQGLFRNGGNMGILNVTHPDILKFIGIKSKDKSIKNFNISVGITDNYMEALKKGRVFPLINPRNSEKVRNIKSKDIFDEICDMAWRTGDPGLAFIDRIEQDNPTPNLGVLNATNPCGEQPLLPYESCNLGAVNLRAHFNHEKKDLDWNMIGETVRMGVHFMDNVIDANDYPVKEIENVTRYKNRKIGVGIMGFADVLMYLGVRYDSEEGLEWAKKIMSFIQKEGHKASSELAKRRGPFPSYQGSRWEEKNRPLRNATVTTIAPNGNTSIIGGSTGGIEPAFSLAYQIGGMEDRNYKATEILFRVAPGFEKVAQDEGFYSEDLVRTIIKKGTASGVSEIPSKYRKVFKTSYEIDPEWHVKMQAVFQKYCDNAVSKTINFRNEATVKDVRKAYLLAYKLGCKGITIYRDGSKAAQTYVSSRGKGKLNVKK